MRFRIQDGIAPPNTRSPCSQTTRQIHCDDASARLIYAAIQEGRAQYNQKLALAALNGTRDAARQFRKAVAASSRK